MKRRGFLLAMLALTGAALAAAGASLTASASTTATRTICHRTSFKSSPYVKLKVSAKTLRAHAKHAADIIPAPSGGCPKTLLDRDGRRPGSYRRAHRQGRDTRRRSGCDGHGDGPPPRRTGPALLSDRGAEPAAGSGIAHPQRRCRSCRSRGDPLQTPDADRQVERVHRRRAGADRLDPRRSGVVLRQRAHVGVPRRRNSRAAQRHLGRRLRLDRGIRPEGLERAECDRHGSDPHPQGRRHGAATGCMPRT